MPHKTGTFRSLGGASVDGGHYHVLGNCKFRGICPTILSTDVTLYPINKTLYFPNDGFLAPYWQKCQLEDAGCITWLGHTPSGIAMQTFGEMPVFGHFCYSLTTPYKILYSLPFSCLIFICTQQVVIESEMLGFLFFKTFSLWFRLGSLRTQRPHTKRVVRTGSCSGFPSPILRFNGTLPVSR